jgi:hypothetical protein
MNYHTYLTNLINGEFDWSAKSEMLEILIRFEKKYTQPIFITSKLENGFFISTLNKIE